LDLLLSLGDRHGISLALGCSPTLSELISLCLIVNGEKFVTLTVRNWNICESTAFGICIWCK
jgi:hypothetical protein